jgi:hypothetical protein
MKNDGQNEHEDLPLQFGGAGPFIRHYLREHIALFAPLALLVAGAASCAVAVQVMMKWLVDAMALGPQAGQERVWQALFGFIALIAAKQIPFRQSSRNPRHRLLLDSVRSDASKPLSGRGSEVIGSVLPLVAGQSA